MHPLQEGILPWLSILAARSAKASLLAGLVALLCLLPRRWLSSPWRHLLWCAVFVRLVLPDVPVPGWSWNVSRLLPASPVFTAGQTPAPFDEALPSLPAPQAEETEIPVTSSPSLPFPTAPILHHSNTPLLQSPNAPPLSWPDILGMLWLGGAVVWWGALGVGAWRFGRLMALASEASPRTQTLLKGCLDETHVRARVQIKCPHHLAVPAVCGVLRPVILIPRTIEVALSSNDLRLLLLHELGHIRRRDTAVQVAASLLLGLHWWNPALWFAWSRLRHESEAATDAWVLRHSDSAAAPAYGAMLLDLAARACAVSLSFLLLPGLMSATSHGKHLRQRLVAISSFRKLHKRAAWWGLVSVTILALTGFSQNAPAPAPNPNAIGGLVVDEQGKPVPGAKIEINFSRPKDTLSKSALPQGPLKPQFTESDAEGHWHFADVPAAVVPETLQDAVGRDTYRLYITHPDFLVGEFSGTGTELGSDASFRQKSAKLTLTHGHMIRGVVRDEKGHAIAGATIERNVNVRHGADPKATTDANGNYVLKAARPGNFVVRVRAEGFALQQQRVILTADESLDFTLKPAHTLTLKLRDAQGNPLTKGFVNFMPTLKPWEDSDRLWIGNPDKDGVVIWKEAPAGEVIAVVHMDGCERLNQQVPTDRETVLTPKPNPPLPMLTVRVKAAGTGKPLTGCTFDTALVMQGDLTHLFWMDDKIHAPLKPSATEGEYIARIPKFSTDPMVLRIRCPGYVPAQTGVVDLRQGNATMEFALKEFSPLTLTVRKADGTPAAHMKVNVAWSDAARHTNDKLLKNHHLLTDFSMARHLEFSGATGEDGRCVLPACADEATVLAMDDSSYAVCDYGRLIKDSTLKLQSYDSDGERMLAKLTLRHLRSDTPLGHLNVRLMREGKPLLDQKKLFILRCSDNVNTSSAVCLPAVADQGVATAAERPGTTVLQMALQSPEGNYWFSPAVTAVMKADETTEVTASLEPGIRVAGRIADEVPRPVKDTLIHVYVTASDEGTQSKLLWMDRRPVREDGSFEFPSLPKGNMRFLVMADGWISPMTHTAGSSNHPWSAGRISESRSNLVVPMQRSASCEVTVTDAEGKVVPGASVRLSAPFSPHEFFHGRLSFGNGRENTLFPSTSLEETFALKLPFMGDRFGPFRVLTDGQGHALIRDLPPLADLSKINVAGPDLDPNKVHSPSNSGTVGPIQPGQTAKVTVRLEKQKKEK